MMMLDPETSGERRARSELGLLVSDLNLAYKNLEREARRVSGGGESYIEIFYSLVTSNDGIEIPVVTLKNWAIWKHGLTHVVGGIGVVDTDERNVEMGWNDKGVAQHPIPFFDYSGSTDWDRRKYVGSGWVDMRNEGWFWQDPWGSKLASGLRRSRHGTNRYWQYGEGFLRGNFPTAKVWSVCVEPIPDISPYIVGVGENKAPELINEYTDIFREANLVGYVDFSRRLIENRGMIDWVEEE